MAVTVNSHITINVYDRIVYATRCSKREVQDGFPRFLTVHYPMSFEHGFAFIASVDYIEIFKTLSPCNRTVNLYFGSCSFSLVFHLYHLFNRILCLCLLT